MSSRESDNAHPQPRRGGPDAYPSGTPPYGTGLPGGLPDPAAARTAPGPRADEAEVPKTETTLTTRVRINIPGSRPIPPVVVQSKVKDEKPAEPAGPRHRGGGGDPVLGVMDAGAGRSKGAPPNLPPEWQEPTGPKASESDSTGEWFKPRQKGRQEPAAAPAPAAPRPAVGPAAPAAGGPTGSPQAAPLPSGAAASPFAPASPYAAEQHPQQASLPGQQQPTAGQDPFAAELQQHEQYQQQAMAAQDPYAAQAQQPHPGQDPYAAQAQQPNPGQDPFAGQPQQPAPGQAPFAAEQQHEQYQQHHHQQQPTPGQAPFAAEAPAAAQHGGQAPFAAEPPAGRGGAPDAEPEDTQIGGFDPVTGEEPAPGGAIAADPPTTQLFLNAPKSPSGPAAADPFAAADRPRPAGGNGGGRFADLPEAQPFPGGPRAATPKREVPNDQPPVEEDYDDEPSSKSAKGGGKVKKLLVTGVGGVLFLGAAAYGAGLMMNQSDIPKGTTVLGTDIGGDSRDQAVTALDGSVGKAGQQPVRLKIGDQSVTLDPASAGLSFDTTATVDALTKHSYNPVEVLSSLTGGGKAVEPQVRVDKAKLKAALDDLAAKSGQGLQEGYVRFTETSAEVVPGKAGQGLDSASAADKVEQAYRDRAAGKPDAELALPLADAQPKVGQDALQAAADGLGKQVLAGNITISAGAKQFNFGGKTATRALVLAPDASGQIVLKWDLDALRTSIGTTFDKVKTTKNGQSALITPQDVADAIGQTVTKTGRDRAYKFPA
ncbi:peptidoglycan binding domain-containing protein [Kitasatospora griseola]|uniref:peptidoglycan binding domain-containing protein n=1 Tax=Kitasatospora griseola TaxID=2064 RepID=UPI00382AF81F